MLGFGGGGILAALRALRVSARVHGSDLDSTGHDLLRNARADWIEPFAWHPTDAFAWLAGTRRRFDVIFDDLSISTVDDVVKPAATWSSLPELVARRLRSGGLAIFNLLRPARDSWPACLERAARPFPNTRTIVFDEFENRLLLAGTALPDSSREIHRRVRIQLDRLRSTQATRFHVRRRPAHRIS